MSFIIQNSNNTKLIDKNSVMLTDCNGKEIVVNVDSINDASTYSSSEMSNTQNINKNMANIQCKIADEDGNVINESDLITDVKDGNIVALDVTFETTHSGRRINYALYNSESMAEDASTFMYPFAKPLIKNHDRRTEPLGRAIDSSFDKSEFLEDSDTINVTWRVSDNDAMLKFADGRYKTMSIGASANKITCNTCGKTILDSGKMKFCGHWRGETYKDSICTWTMTGLQYREGSVVNDPADEYAQVKKIKVMRKGDSNMSQAKNSNTTNSAVGGIDDILNSNPTGVTPAEPVVTNGTQPNEPVAAIAVTDAEKIASLEAELQTAKDELETLKLSHVSDLATKESEIEVLKAEKIVTDSDIAVKKEQLITMAKLNKQLLTDNLIDLDPKIKDEINEKSATELSQMVNDLRSKPRPIVQLQDPGIKINDQNTKIEGEQPEPKKAINTMMDMKDLVDKIFHVN